MCLLEDNEYDSTDVCAARIVSPKAVHESEHTVTAHHSTVLIVSFINQLMQESVTFDP